MACKQCRKNIVGNFIVFNPVAFLEDKTKSSINAPKGTKIKLGLHFHCHSDRKSTYKSIDLIDKMTDVSNNITQAEDYFCSKKCLLTWLERILKNIPNP